MFKKSSINPVMLKGIKNKKFAWLNILLVIKLAIIKDNPPPLGLIILCELLWFGISGIITLKGFIINLVINQLKIKLQIRIKEIFKI